MLYSKLQSRNDTVPTKQNDAAAFYQQATISLAKNQILVVEFPSKPINSWLGKITQNEDASTNLDDAVLDMPHRCQLLVNQQESILHNDLKSAVALNQTRRCAYNNQQLHKVNSCCWFRHAKTVLATRHSLVDPFNCARQPPTTNNYKNQA
ncbi:protein phosphatase 2C 37-like [Dorcoceras hygrometricum]|uniref:Protein phosphatase 2C 37-like n=1 Tax=Dorcoceras hygrometricum TaxID=472368 RepID=A0A2Z7AG49_9LAMI|nr:protein phosphatase 2C 37-like [Dorcoceras hygrometricum]